MEIRYLAKKEKNSEVEVSNLSIKVFNSLLRKSHEKFDAYMVINVKTAKSDSRSELVKKSARFEELLENYSSDFQEKLPYGLRQKRNVDHAIEVVNGTKPPCRPLL